MPPTLAQFERFVIGDADLFGRKMGASELRATVIGLLALNHRSDVMRPLEAIVARAAKKRRPRVAAKLQSWPRTSEFRLALRGPQRDGKLGRREARREVDQ